MRATNLADGAAITPQQLFAQGKEPDEIILIDRLCRLIHTQNFQTFAPAESWLFLNLSPHIILNAYSQGLFVTAELLKQANIPPQRVVIEILEKKIADEALLAEAMAHYRAEGYLTAVDDFGAGQSNFDRIWRLQPDIVKLDRSIIANSAINPRARRVLPSLVSLIHEAGCLVLIEGIETATEAMISMDSDVDLVQGYFFSHPKSDIQSLDGMGEKQVNFLSHEFSSHSNQDACRQLQALENYLEPFLAVVQSTHDDSSLLDGCDRLLQQPGIVCCFILDGTGRQIGDNKMPGSQTVWPTGKYAHLAGFAGADWSRRSYLGEDLFRR